MTRVLIDESMQKNLENSGQPIEFVDEAGHVVGVFTPGPLREPQISEEEIARRENESESFSTTEVLEYLESL